MNSHLRGMLAAFVLLSLLGEEAFAQTTAANDAYKPLELTKPRWPAFYKPDPNDAKYSKMLSDGNCKPTGKRAREYYLSKLVDVNKLPEFAFTGKVAGAADGALKVVDDASGENLIVVLHPGVSRVIVAGKGTTDLLTSGVFIRFVGRVDAHGIGSEAIDRFEIISPSREAPAPIEPNKLQSLTGKLIRRDGEHLVVLTASSNHRRLEVDLKPDADVVTRLSDYRYAAEGDAVKFRGRILRSTPGRTFCFAEDLEIATATRPPYNTKNSAMASRNTN